MCIWTMSRVFPLICLLVYTLSCSSPYYISYKKVNFYYTFTGQECGSFTFDKCQWKACLKQESCCQGNSICVEWGYFNETSWEKCTHSYCDPDVDYAQHYDSIGHCEEYHHQKHMQLVYGLAFGLGLGLPCLCFIPFFICVVIPKIKEYAQRRRENRQRENLGYCGERCEERCRRCPCFGREGGEDQDPNHPDVPAVEWASANQLRDPSLECSICLEDNPRLQLLCSHMFHVPCILTYIARSRQCPVCHSEELDTARMACEECGQATREVDLRRGIELIANRQVCDNCQHNE